MTAHMNNAKLGLLLPAILNPAVAAALGIGIVAVGLYRLLPDDDEDATVKEMPTNDPEMAIPVTEQPVPTVEVDEVQPDDLPSIPSLQADDDILETDQTEMIRNAMSELGKRSAAARARKKAERHEVM